MEQTIFTDYLKFFQPLVQKYFEQINGAPKEKQMLHKTMLKDEYSADLRWGANTFNRSIAAADVVAMDSPLPLKRRSTLATASGNLPKLGMKIQKGERYIKDIQIMEASGANGAQIAAKLYDDVPTVISGVDYRKEIMFQQALSTGYCLIEDDQNTGIGIRVDYGFKSTHFIESAHPWGTAGYTPQDDIDKVLSKADADGNTITCIMMSKKYFNLMKSSDQGKMMAATFGGYPYTKVSTLPVPSSQTFKSAFEDIFQVTLIVVDSSFRIEKNGVQTSVKPWEQDNVAFLYDSNCGRLVYGDVAEKNNPVTNVTYQIGTQGTLVSKYSTTDPLTEFTASQAMALPVIDGVDGIYILEADKTAIVLTTYATEPANTTGNVTVTATTDASTITATSDSSWLTASVSGKTITVTWLANATGVERTGVVTVTDSNDNSQTITVKQAA